VYRAEIKLIRKADRMSVYALYLRGSAFLWHQVRCMMAVLFLIGKGQEEVSLIKHMLDVAKCPTKPK